MHPSLSFSFSFVLWLGFELRASMISKQTLYHCHISSSFCSGYFGEGIFAQAGFESQSSRSQFPKLLGL
jgi:hypothetical protein